MSDIKKTLYTHLPHWHKPVNVNEKHAEEQTSLNARVAVFLTTYVGTMGTAYAFTVLALITIFAVLGVFGVLSPIVAAIGAAISQTLIQLVLLPVIMVGQNVLNRHSELLAEEQFNTTLQSEHEIEQIMLHLDSQDSKILEIAQKVEQMEKIETTEVLKHSDILEEILEIVKSRSQAVALTSAASYEPDVQPKSVDKKGKAKA